MDKTLSLYCAHTYTHMHQNTHTCTHTHTHAHTHAQNIHAHTLPLSLSLSLSLSHTHTNSHTHTHTYTRNTHTHTRTHYVWALLGYFITTHHLCVIPHVLGALAVWRQNIKKNPGSAWLERTPAMDLGYMNLVLKWMYLYFGSVFRTCNVILK